LEATLEERCRDGRCLGRRLANVVGQVWLKKGFGVNQQKLLAACDKVFMMTVGATKDIE
jgi:hypothetical protein